MIMQRGFRAKLDTYLNTALPIQVKISTKGVAVYDSCCFGVDSSDRLSDDRYMIFYNQTESPNREITYSANGNNADYIVNLTQLPPQIAKLVFTVSIDGNGTMGQIQSQEIQIFQNNQIIMELTLKGSDFHQEKAVIDLEIYRKAEWRVSVVASGFNGGLPDLLKNFGGEEIDSTDEQAQISAPVTQTAPNYNTSQFQQTPTVMQSARIAPQSAQVPPVTQTAPNYNTSQFQQTPTVTQSARIAPQSAQVPPITQTESNNNISANQSAVSNNGFTSEKKLTNRVMNKISLSKDKVNLEKHVVNLSKCVVDLSKKSGVDLGDMRAKVVVVLDYSGSMSREYKKGIIQDTLNRLVPLGLTFDDNGSVDVFLFQTDFKKMDDLNLSNYENYVKNVIKRSKYPMGGTNYAPVLKAIIEGYNESKGFFSGSTFVPPIVDNNSPTFILFVTDGDAFDERETDNIIRKSSQKNIFIQFIGIGNATFSYLMKLDDLRGRARDNTGFTRMVDLMKATDDELYTNVLEQFSKWLRGLQ